MNVTPRQRTCVEPTRWKVTCGICLHAFEAQADYTPRIQLACPNCGTGNVWSEPDAPPVEAPAASLPPAAASEPPSAAT